MLGWAVALLQEADRRSKQSFQLFVHPSSFYALSVKLDLNFFDLKPLAGADGFSMQHFLFLKTELFPIVI